MKNKPFKLKDKIFSLNRMEKKRGLNFTYTLFIIKKIKYIIKFCSGLSSIRIKCFFDVPDIDEILS